MTTYIIKQRGKNIIVEKRVPRRGMEILFVSTSIYSVELKMKKELDRVCCDLGMEVKVTSYVAGLEF